MNDEGTSLFDDDDNDGVLREETSLFGAAAKDKTYRSGSKYRAVNCIYGIYFTVILSITASVYLPSINRTKDTYLRVCWYCLISFAYRMYLKSS